MNHMAETSTDSPRIPFFGLNASEADAAVVAAGWPRFRADQLRDWVYRKHVNDPQWMTNFTAADRNRIAETFSFATAETTKDQVSEDGTRKLLLTWPSGVA